MSSTSIKIKKKTSPRAKRHQNTSKMFSDHHDDHNLDKDDAQLNWLWLRFIGCVPISIQSTEWRGPTMILHHDQHHIYIKYIYLYHIQPFFIIFTPHIFFFILMICPLLQTIRNDNFVDFWMKYMFSYMKYIFFRKGSTLITIKIGFG